MDSRIPEILQQDNTGAVLTVISHSYKKREVLNSLSLELAPGITALVGPNGAGKTTLIKILATLLKPRSGSVQIGDYKLDSRQAIYKARSQIGYLPQDFGGDPSFTVGDYLAYCAWLRQVPNDQIDIEISRVLKLVELEDRAKTRFRALSGGMRQRAGIAATVLGSPKLILLDEPTVGLDPEQRLVFRKLLRSLTGTSILLSTHLIEDVLAVSDRILVLNRGGFQFDGGKHELLDRAGSNLDMDISPAEAAYLQILGASQ